MGLLADDELDDALDIVLRMFPDVLKGSPPFADVLSLVSGGALYVYFAREARRKRARHDGLPHRDGPDKKDVAPVPFAE